MIGTSTCFIRSEDARCAVYAAVSRNAVAETGSAEDAFQNAQLGRILGTPK